MSKVFTITRRELPVDPKVSQIASKDNAEWAKMYPSGSEVFYSALGTTRAAAGGFENQRKIDYDLNLELAKAARAAGTKVYVLISSSGASSTSPFGVSTRQDTV